MSKPDFDVQARQLCGGHLTGDFVRCRDIAAALATAYQQGQQEMAETIAKSCDANAAGPITGDGIIGPLQVVGIQQAFQWAARSAREIAALAMAGK